jgi:hypothetical protein
LIIVVYAHGSSFISSWLYVGIKYYLKNLTLLFCRYLHPSSVIFPHPYKFKVCADFRCFSPSSVINLQKDKIRVCADFRCLSPSSVINLQKDKIRVCADFRCLSPCRLRRHCRVCRCVEAQTMRTVHLLFCCNQLNPKYGPILSV